MSKKNRQSKNQAKAAQPEKSAGYGDKKLEGPNRPAE